MAGAPLPVLTPSPQPPPTGPPVVTPAPAIDPQVAAQAARVAAERDARKQVRREARRNRVAVVLVILASGLLGLTAITTWVNGRLISTSGYVSTVQPVAANPEVIDAVTEELLTQIGDPLLDQADGLAGTPSGPDGAELQPDLFEPEVVSAIASAIASPTFAAVWASGQTATQTQIVALLDGAVPTQQQLDGTDVVIDLAPLSPLISAQLAQAGYAFAAAGTPVPAPLEIRTTSTVAPYTETLDALRGLWWLIPFLAVLALAGAYAFSTRRLRLTLVLGVDVALAMGAVVLTGRLLKKVAGEGGVGLQDQSLLTAMYEPFGQALTRSGVIGAVVGGVIALVAIIAISIRGARERRVRSQQRREAFLALQQAAAQPHQ